eukprot:1156611-Pelagomonas_calceolata.AAC.2
MSVREGTAMDSTISVGMMVQITSSVVWSACMSKQQQDMGWADLRNHVEKAALRRAMCTAPPAWCGLQA